MRPEAGRHPSYPVVERSWDAVFKLLRHQSPAAGAFGSCGLSFMASLWKTLYGLLFHQMIILRLIPLPLPCQQLGVEEIDEIGQQQVRLAL